MARTLEAGTKRDKMIPGIKATQQELDEINARAKSVGMNRSEYIRVMLFERAPKHKPKKLQLVDDHVVAELARQGGNLRDLFNQHGHENGYPSEESKEVLLKMGRTVDTIHEVFENHLRKELHGR